MINRKIKSFKFSYEEFSKMLFNVTSRALNINMNGTPTLAFVPIMDMMNHNNKSQIELVYNQKGLIIKALEDIQAG